MLKKLAKTLVWTEKKSLVILTAGTILLSLLEVFSIGIILPIMGLIIAPEKIHSNKLLILVNRWMGSLDDRFFLILLILSAIILFILKSAYSVFILNRQQAIVGKIYTRLTNQALVAYLKKPYAFHLLNNSSVLFKNVIVEISDFVLGFLSSLVVIGSEMIVFLGIALLLFFTYPAATFALVGLFGLVTLFTNQVFKNRIKAYASRRQSSSEQIYKSALEALNGIKEIQVYDTWNFFSRRFQNSTEQYASNSVKFYTVSALSRTALEVFLFVSVFTFLLINIILKADYSQMIPAMTLIAVASIRLIPSFNKISINMNTLHYYANSLDMVYRIVLESNAVDGHQKLKEQAPFVPQGEDDTIRLSNIKFCYDSANTPIFEKLDFSVAIGRTTALFGATGAGKSTLIDIITGLLIPQDGVFYYKGKLINENNFKEYIAKVGYVPQQVFLYDDTLEANIIFGSQGGKPDRRKLEKVLKISQLDSLVEELPLGLETLIGDKGARLSGGQRQRIGIARAFYRDPEIIILDEATGALDRLTESKIFKAISEMPDKKTLIMITHRLSTIEYADLIFVMERGKIIDQGEFLELSSRSQAFKRIIEKKPLETAKEI
ncbi:MAG: ABC transporter ATP-binding protein [Candidatus Omnitrophica bacterium]|nr:ABC transporter ATP-binding protein [Candidatus Omnitrophota bacterium]